MGTCVSLHKDTESALRFRVGAPAKEKKLDGEEKIADSALSRSDFGSKDDIFFDSNAWIDSDCEDDFYSVKGDFTPSRGSTPVHPSILPVTPQLNRTFIEVFPVTPPEPSPRKKLSELLLEISDTEKIGNGQTVDERIEKKASCGTPTQNSDPPTKTVNGTSYSSKAKRLDRSESLSNGVLENEKVKDDDKVVRCCLPSVHSFGIYKQRKQRASPKHQHTIQG